MPAGGPWIPLVHQRRLSTPSVSEGTAALSHELELSLVRLHGLARALVWASLPVVLATCDAARNLGGDCTYPELPTGDCSPWLPPATGGRTWQLSFSEEFEGSGYDAAKLTP